MPPKKQSTASTGYRRKPYQKRAVKANIKTAIKTYIAKSQETKTVSIQLPNTAFNSGIGSTSEYYALVPACAQGSGQTNRIGESIVPQKIVVRGYINFRANQIQSAQELIARLFCFQDKSIKAYANLTSVGTNLLDLGGAGTPFTGTLMNMCTPHNSDKFTFFADKKHTFLKPFGYTNNGVQTSAITSMNSSLVWFFNITLDKKHLPATFKYDGSDYPLNFCPLLALGYSYAQDDSPDTVSTQISMAYNSTLYYKDA